MLFLTRHFGVTGSDADRDPVREKAEIEEIVGNSLLLQEKSAAQQHRPIGRGTHVKGVCARAQFEVLDVTAGRDAGAGNAACERDIRQTWHFSCDRAVWKFRSEKEF